jgi:hypothetical protein
MQLVADSVHTATPVPNGGIRWYRAARCEYESLFLNWLVDLLTVRRGSSISCGPLTARASLHAGNAPGGQPAFAPDNLEISTATQDVRLPVARCQMPWGLTNFKTVASGPRL